MKNFKKVLALVLVVAMMMSFVVVASAKTTADYTDADKVTYTEAVDVLSYLEVLGGYPDGTFKPTATITRAEAAKIIAIFANGSTEISTLYTGMATPFTDVKGTWAESYVNYCYAAGIVSGKSATTFDPNANVTGAEFLKMALVVLGFDAEKEGFVGSAWAINTLKMANAIELLDDLAKGWDPAKAITREEAAQVMFTALPLGKVYYRFSFSNAEYAGTSLLDNWDIEKSAATEYDDWGRPYTKWVDDKGTPKTTDDVVVVTYKVAPVATYNAAVKQSAILKDLGLKKDQTFKKEFVHTNGIVASADVVIADNDALTYGEQGRLMEIYKVDDDYQLVMIDTYLAKAGKPVAEKLNSSGNVTVDAHQPLTVYYSEAGGPAYIKGNDYAENDYLLVNVNEAKTQTIKGVTGAVAKVEVVGKPETLTAKLTGFNTIKNTFTFDKAYLGSNKFYVKPATNVIGSTYDLYLDQYGNLIGQKAHEDAKSYAFAIQGTIATDVFNTSYVAKLVDFEGNATVEKVATWNNGVPTWAGIVDLGDELVTVVETTKGLALTPVADVVKITSDGKITKGTPCVYEGAIIKGVTDANTTYLVKTADGFSVYTGYAAMPSVENAKIVLKANIDTDAYVDIVYVDATAAGAVFTGADQYAYVLTSVSDDGDAQIDGVTYDVVTGVVINGELQDYVLVAQTAKAGLIALAGKAVTLKYNAAGYVIGAVDASLSNDTVAATASGAVVNLTTAGACVVSDTAVIWVIDETAKTCTVGTAADFIKDRAVLVKVASGAITKAVIKK